MNNIAPRENKILVSILHANYLIPDPLQFGREDRPFIPGKPLQSKPFNYN
ncbi:hypothetical protein NTGZN8_280021 [Candidatus Nitrotoga fabula]|uniref:Uncharacterized protein n=1 Tax=Candidatus Nitrotoga fabula TaxID=2182327 RepID=A0A916BGB5_9PROT|nr:hypothetical protein NTGZN8_280021 [Candidatus Nitrotoga fabula]